MFFVIHLFSVPFFLDLLKTSFLDFFQTLTCFIALILIRLLQYKTNWVMSPARMINALNSAKATHLQDDYYRLQENSDMKELNKLLGHDWQRGIVKFEELKNYAKNSYTTLK